MLCNKLFLCCNKGPSRLVKAWVGYSYIHQANFHIKTYCYKVAFLSKKEIVRKDFGRWCKLSKKQIIRSERPLIPLSVCCSWRGYLGGFSSSRTGSCGPQRICAFRRTRIRICKWTREGLPFCCMWSIISCFSRLSFLQRLASTRPPRLPWPQ